MMIKTYNAIVISDDEREVSHLKLLFSEADLSGVSITYLSSAQACNFLVENRPGIVFLDFQHDMIFVFRVLSAIANLGNYSPELIFITRQHPNDIDFVAQAGFIHFCKPADKDLLKGVVKRINAQGDHHKGKTRSRQRILQLLESVNYSGN